MNRRKAKKRVKKQWGLDSWTGHAEPRKVDRACWTAFVAILSAMDEEFERQLMGGEKP